MKLEKFKFNFNESISREKSVRLEAERAMEFYGLIDKGWKLVFDTRSKRRLGQCRYYKKEIGISLFYAKNDELKTIGNTILHEIAHALDFHKRGHSGHDYVWRSIALAIGCNGNRCTSAKAKPKGKYEYECISCGEPTYFHRKITRTYACSTCCNEYAYGRYDERFILKLKKIN